MTKALYMADCYIKEFEAVVENVSDSKYVLLDQTAFFPKGGGVAWDTGKLVRIEDGVEFPVIYTGKFSGNISHEVQNPVGNGLKKGDEVKGILDWERRYMLMRYHTAAHIVSGVFHNEGKMKITGNELDAEKGRIDFNMDDFDREQILKFIGRSNEIVRKDLPVKIYSVPREQADPILFKLAMGFPHDVQEVRVVDIVGFDRQADGGCHVKSTKEVGTIAFQKAENKGKNNRRVYFTIS